MKESSQLHLQYWGQNVFQMPFENKSELSSGTFADIGILCSLGLTGKENEWELPVHDSWQPLRQTPGKAAVTVHQRAH